MWETFFLQGWVGHILSTGGDAVRLNSCSKW